VIQIAEEAPAEAAAVAAAAAAPLPMDIPVVVPYWNVIKAWAATIAEGTAHTEGEKPPAGAKAWPDLPSELVKEIKARYAGDEAKREEQRLLGVAWMYESIRGGATGHREVLAQALLEFIWDESLKPNEQHALLRGAPEGSLERRIGREQIQRQDAVEAFRYIDTQTGKIRYIFPDGKPNEALSKLLEASKSDPLYGIKADKESSGPVYGFLVPKAKEGRLVFKTSDSPPAPGGNPEKGGECAIVSTIALHIKAVKALARILEAEELPKFFFTDDVLDEKERRLKAREAAKKAGQAEPTFPPLNKNRTFENMGRACAIIDLTLRWLDITIERRSGGGAAAGGAPGVWRRFFYRPIAALRSKHKGTVAK
jgi:hypothetical protein